MNILVPHSWLLKHLDTNASPADIQRCLSLCGPSVENVYVREAEHIYDIEVTTNRVDTACIRGIAREAAVILPEFGFKASLKKLDNIELNSCSKKLDINIQNDPKLCHRIIAIKLSNINLGPSPAWMQKQLELIGQRPINNAIDITNFVMWDIGHPIHAFDYNQLTSKKIIVREAKPGEKFVTLDGKQHKCLGGEVVFDDGNGNIIDLPGIMGTKNTSVNESTKNILLWIESVDAVKIRQASMGLAIRTQAAILNEKQVDPELAPIALNQAVKLFIDTTNASVDSSVYDEYPAKSPIRPVMLSQHQVDTYLGLNISPDRVDKILTGLGCKTEIKSNDKVTNTHVYKVFAPSWRLNDLKLPQDLIEEIARIYGYHNLPSVIMATTIPYHPSTENFNFEYQVKQWLAGWGAKEIYTYSMISKETAKKSGAPLSDHLRITNPLSDEWVFMRRTLIPSVQQVFANHDGSALTLFEMQNVYIPKDNGLPNEDLHLTLVSNQSFKHIKGILDALMIKCHIQEYEVIPEKTPEPFLPNQSGIIYAEKTKLGTIGAIDEYLYAFDLEMKRIQKITQLHPSKLNIANYPPVIEDLTFTMPAHTYIGPIISDIKSVNEKIVEVNLKDVYNQNYTLTIIYRSEKDNLTSEEVGPIRQKIVDQLEKKYQAKLVGKLKP